jgi:hypothetical protein
MIIAADPTEAARLDRLCIDTIRTLSIDGVQKANSGHPGAPMGMAPMAYALWTRFLRHAPTRPDWPDRDRFVLSAGHASMLIYSLLHLTGYEVSLDDLRSFRQWGSITPGHPEYGLTPGVEATTGPLGQGSRTPSDSHRGLAWRRVRPTGPRDRRPLDLRHLLDGDLRRHRVRPRRTPGTSWAPRLLYDDSGISSMADVDGFQRGRARSLHRLRVAHPAGHRRQ